MKNRKPRTTKRVSFAPLKAMLERLNMTDTEFCDYLGLSSSAVCKWRKDDEMPVYAQKGMEAYLAEHDEPTLPLTKTITITGEIGEIEELKSFILPRYAVEIG